MHLIFLMNIKKEETHALIKGHTHLSLKGEAHMKDTEQKEE